jgi:hypothetical protein
VLRYRVNPRPALIGWPPRPSTGSRWRFSLVFPSGGFGFSLIFRMIKAKKMLTSHLGFSFEALETNFVVLKSIFDALESIFEALETIF